MPVLFVWLVDALSGAAIRYIGPAILQGLVFFGLTFFTQKYVTTNFVSFIQGALGGAPSMAVAALAAVQFDKAITIILGAYVTAAGARLVLRRRTS